MRTRFLVVSAWLLLPAIGNAQSFHGIGDLNGGNYESFAWGVSGNGKTVVGYSVSGNGLEAAVWRDGSLTPLGDLPGGHFSSNAGDVI